MILAGDIGGTKTVLALYGRNNQGELQCEFEQTYFSAEYPHFHDILSVFIPADTTLNAACFGIAGPIVEQRCQITNLPWLIDAAELSIKLRCNRVKLLNDLEATAIGMLNIPSEDLVELNPSAQRQQGNIAVIAAGTGLGEAILYWDGQRHHPMATEGGHCDFAPQTQQQDLLLSYLRKQFNGHVSWERVLSGAGFGHLYDFLVDINYAPACPAVPAANSVNALSDDRNAIISRLGLNVEDRGCAEALRLFVELYGAEAGNLALKCLATGGVYIGGGIAPKIRPVLENGDFLRAFSDKGRFQTLLSGLSVKLSLNPNTALIGAAHYFSD
ncbi:glucokinase [Methylomarinum sp. Ch1-1]|uniref:Glucokinase n=1 Tax=Methylomarinum roseum TaxID=3067653 RepID=A0AAU7NX72_9GAMM|nr:glucokinase [Methylomarinum sp. Ch1-1]MDP4522792.1 glucokinase [Methylomarinum sp. Ch1-1]